MQTLEYANELMPENYMWAIGTQVASSAKNDGQSGGDSTTNADNGGQLWASDGCDCSNGEHKLYL
mgnify:CR=1 FL=1